MSELLKPCSPESHQPRLMGAVEALDTMDARIPWQDPNTGRGGLRRVVSVGDIPRGPGVLDDVVRMVVDLPPGSGPGPFGLTTMTVRLNVTPPGSGPWEGGSGTPPGRLGFRPRTRTRWGASAASPVRSLDKP